MKKHDWTALYALIQSSPEKLRKSCRPIQVYMIRGARGGNPKKREVEAQYYDQAHALKGVFLRELSDWCPWQIALFLMWTKPFGETIVRDRKTGDVLTYGKKARKATSTRKASNDPLAVALSAINQIRRENAAA